MDIFQTLGVLWLADPRLGSPQVVSVALEPKGGKRSWRCADAPFQQIAPLGRYKAQCSVATGCCYRSYNSLMSATKSITAPSKMR